MTVRSRYDELHDRYHAALISKAGTRYERLAAVVFKILEEGNVVIHDLKLVGDSDVKHQIDVSIEANGTRRRVIIECKDFDVSGDDVGLDILRSFRSVIEDTGADEGIVLTCNGYTRDARKYAKAKSIKLAVLRQAEPGDLAGIIQKVVIQMHVQSNHDARTTISMPQASHDVFMAELQRAGISGGIHDYQPVYLVKGAEKMRFTEFISREVNGRRAEKQEDDRWRLVTPADGWSLQVDEGPLVPFDGIVTTFAVHTETIPIVVASNRIAELIVSGLGEDDIIIFDDQIRRYKINEETGEICQPTTPMG